VEAGGFHLPLCFGHLVAGSFQGCRPLFQCVRDLEIRFVCDFQSLLHGWYLRVRHQHLRFLLLDFLLVEVVIHSIEVQENL
jgi:hypothetical protein